MVSGELCVDCCADLVECLALIVKSHDKPTLSLTDRAVSRHAFGFIAGKKRIEFDSVGAAAVAVYAVDYLRDLANRVEERNELRVLLEFLAFEHKGAINARTWHRMFWRGVRETRRDEDSSGRRRQRSQEVAASEVIRHVK